MPKTDAEYEAWQHDSSRDQYRIMLIEADCVDGTVRLGSQPWISNAHLSYDDWLATLPYMESRENSIGSIGDFEAYNHNNAADNWNHRLFHGQECRWLFGDMAWRQEDFRTIASSLIDAVKPQGSNRFRFELMDHGQRLKRSLVTSDTTRVESVNDAVEWVMDQTGVTVSMVNVSSTKQGWELSYAMTPNTTGFEVIMGIARSINAHVSVDQLGNVEIGIFNAADSLVIDADSIGSGNLSVQDIIPAYVSVTVIKSDDTRQTGDTDVVTGTAVGEIDIQSYLTSTGNADTLLGEYKKYYSNPHAIWSIPVTIMEGLVDIGKPVTIFHPELSETGRVVRIYRSPLSSATDIEIEI